MKNTLKLALVGATLLLATPALADDTHHQNTEGDDAAQQQLNMMGGAMMGNAMMAGSGAKGGMMSMMTPMLQMMSPKHIEGRLAFLKTELKITEAQAPAWNKFADAMRESVNDATHSMPGMDGSMMPQKGSDGLIERMSVREHVLTQELSRVQKLEAAVKPLYTAFSDEQKRTADELLMPALLGHM
ncbi:MAG: hypothetical protein E6Q98_01380 [Rhodospirillaceae bacterium]|nr:MAG: hypothetical protein E6Q98_01380 [Rhodospirillaceae bacterium]